MSYHNFRELLPLGGHACDCVVRSTLHHDTGTVSTTTVTVSTTTVTVTLHLAAEGRSRQLFITSLGHPIQGIVLERVIFRLWLQAAEYVFTYYNKPLSAAKRLEEANG